MTKEELTNGIKYIWPQVCCKITDNYLELLTEVPHNNDFHTMRRSFKSSNETPTPQEVIFTFKEFIQDAVEVSLKGPRIYAI